MLLLFPISKDFYEIIDLFNGQKDIESKIITTVGNAEERFKEDYLRMMRAIGLKHIRK
jgi:tRNA nucleotidyltransferase/poly(A) polymerase